MKSSAIEKRIVKIDQAIQAMNIAKKYLGNDLAGNIKSPTYTFTTPADCYYIRFIAETRDTNFKIYLKEVIN